MGMYDWLNIVLIRSIVVYLSLFFFPCLFFSGLD